MTSPEDDRPLVGRDLPWRLIGAEIFRVIDFTPVATVDEKAKVTAPPVPMPYGLLTVESPILVQPAAMPVNHRLDFLNFWDIYSQGGVGEGHHLLVSYLPYRGFLGPVVRLFSPVLHLFVMSTANADDLFARMSEDPKERHVSARYLFATPDRCFGCGTKLYGMMTRCTKCQTPLYPISD